eukprot:scaffold185082_cov24-Tisochrysis_lutea.AAC.2
MSSAQRDSDIQCNWIVGIVVLYWPCPLHIRFYLSCLHCAAHTGACGNCATQPGERNLKRA